jgi:predicted nucleotidyltransferase component of viral defense system
MIHTSKQLKDRVRNISSGNSDEAQRLIRNFMMERFLERGSCSRYKTNFILKGGMLVASMIGTGARATMDIDTTVKALPLYKDDIQRIMEEILSVPAEDGVSFEIMKISDIMTDFEYPGIRMILEARLDRLKQRIKIDISTDDAITPSAVKYGYQLMFEDRCIELMTYTAETLLSEKIQTILARSITTTRMRDYYDVYELTGSSMIEVDLPRLKKAFAATCKKRKTVFETRQMMEILEQILEDSVLPKLWLRYRRENCYVGELNWETVSKAVCSYIEDNLIMADKNT